MACSNEALILSTANISFAGLLVFRKELEEHQDHMETSRIFTLSIHSGIDIV